LLACRVMEKESRGSHQGWLERVIAENGGVAGSVHVYSATSDLLELTASVNLPPPVVAITQTIPKGKGMAGLAWERQRPVQTCNLQQGGNPDVRPGARAVNAQAAIAIPVHDTSGALRGVVGIAFMGEREIVGEELARLEHAAQQLP
jgi:L-methionine (R)-S-oxide reductase